jgi:hypothetical protein
MSSVCVYRCVLCHQSVCMHVYYIITRVYTCRCIMSLVSMYICVLCHQSVCTHVYFVISLCAHKLFSDIRSTTLNPALGRVRGFVCRNMGRGQGGRFVCVVTWAGVTWAVVTYPSIVGAIILSMRE